MAVGTVSKSSYSLIKLVSVSRALKAGLAKIPLIWRPQWNYEARMLPFRRNICAAHQVFLQPACNAAHGNVEAAMTFLSADHSRNTPPLSPSTQRYSKRADPHTRFLRCHGRLCP